ncbi:helix-turn-helix domain-containing protein [Streptomyces sp. NPDC002143]
MPVDAYARLADTLERLCRASGQPIHQLPTVLSVSELSERSAIPEAEIVTLLQGRQVDESPVADRVRERLDFLRNHCPRPDGKRYSLQQLAAIAGVSRQTMAEWRDGGKPNLDSVESLRKFFGLSPGFLTAEAPEALDAALQPELQRYETQSDPLAALRTPGFLKLALRAANMPAHKRQALEEWASMITEGDSRREVEG